MTSDHIKKAIDKNIVGLLAELAEVYPYQAVEITDSLIRIWQNHLRDFPSDVLQIAADIHINSRAEFPSIAELRWLATELQAGDQLNFPEAYAAYETVQAEIQRIGFCGQPQFDNPLTAETVQRLGWRVLCQSPNASEDRRYFVECYDRLMKREQVIAIQPPEMQTWLRALPGFDQLHLSQGGTHD